ncbi:TPA: hypothetical protein ACPI21_001009 [Haemophilus influenzae]|uniref:hypothetical protein n=1 Tax=Haemophilus influenzae TaxID=727 RepID=UPI00068360CC|nr:hypothetical protein [Haemophilus influenzae]KMZ23786.1 hypothetical protein ABN54_01005 [Haemophilus influenzae]MCK8884081.1 hypothetical protein [Haemophilus influenzae]PRI45260.1 hypothetical protein BVZ71_00770 [Haemophilus influenzae]PRM36707.1 hypothetical protein BVZ73_01326 [Haemophilus influenzae]
MRQYHLTFFCNELPQNTLFYIVKASNSEDAIKCIEDKVKEDFYREYGRACEYEVKKEFFDLDTYPLSNKEVTNLLLNPTEIDGDILGRLIVWFNDQDVDNITSILDENYLENLENLVSFPTEIRADPDKLEKLRDIKLNRATSCTLPEKTK